jgi:predicted RNA-binding Zn-ribbon protein involved in translation (DUF1610 family)
VHLQTSREFPAIHAERAAAATAAQRTGDLALSPSVDRLKRLGRRDHGSIDIAPPSIQIIPALDGIRKAAEQVVKFIWCELNAESGHHWRMSTDTRLIVHFSCPQCATIYAASQEQRPGRHLGDFYCRNCGTPVHSWTGLYNFSDWMPVSTTPSKKRTRQRRCNDDPR